MGKEIGMRAFEASSSILTAYQRRNEATRAEIIYSGLGFSNEDLGLMTDSERLTVNKKIDNIKKSNNKKYIAIVNNIRKYIASVQAATDFRYAQENTLGHNIDDKTLRSVAEIVSIFYHAGEILPSADNVISMINDSSYLTSWTQARAITEAEILMAIELIIELDLTLNTLGLNRWQSAKHINMLFNEGVTAYKAFEYIGYKATKAASKFGIFANWALGK